MAAANETSLNSTLDTVHLSLISLEDGAHADSSLVAAEGQPVSLSVEVESRTNPQREGRILEEQEAGATPVTVPEASNELDSGRPDFSMGDHVYMWCSVVGIPHVYQHHGIVLDVYWQEDANKWVVKIADFSNWSPADGDEKEPKRKKSLRSTGGGCIRSYEVTDDHHQWHKVVYKASFWHRHLGRSGTCTAADCDPPGLVRARVQFLMDHPEVLPPYNVVQANCECIAVWAKCGTVGTLQAMSWLHLTAAGQVKSAATLATAVASTQVTVPAAGLWGWLGYTTHVSLASTQPLLLPAIAAYGAVTVGLPAVWLLRAKQKWKGLTEKLNTAFWESAMEHPDVFVECITEWSIQE